MLKLIVSLLVLTVIIQERDSARILAIIPTASYSHQMFFQQLWRELAIRGHDMVVITTDPTGEKLPNFREISIKESYGPTKEMKDMFINNNIFSILWNNKISQIATKLLNHQIALPQVQEIMTNHTEHFDLLMVEHFIGIYFGLKHRYKCPVIGVISMDGTSLSHEVMGNPVHSVLYPSPMLPFQENMSFFQRIASVGLDFMFNRIQVAFLNSAINVTQRYFGNVDLLELFSETDMLFVNANPLFSPVRPHTPSTISLAGGIHMKPEKPLPKDLKEYLDEAKEGVIYLSLGTNVKSKELSLELRQTIMDTLAKVPYKILWKFEDDTLPDKPANVKIIKWSPQQDVLRHKNLKLFITQGGLQSLEEALYTHIPLIVIPFMGDQVANAEKVKSKGLGVVLDRYTLTVENFQSAILEVIKNPVYKMKVKELATQIQDEPMKPLEKAIWWTEYVLRHNGAQHLKGPKIPSYQYYYLDVLSFLTFVVIAIVGVLYLLVKLTFSCAGKVCCRIANIEKKPKHKKS